MNELQGHGKPEKTYRCECPDLLGFLEIFGDFCNPWAPLPFLPLSQQGR